MDLEAHPSALLLLLVQHTTHCIYSHDHHTTYAISLYHTTYEALRTLIDSLDWRFPLLTQSSPPSHAVYSLYVQLVVES
jgi:hypothetical protein